MSYDDTQSVEEKVGCCVNMTFGHVTVNFMWATVKLVAYLDNDDVTHNKVYRKCRLCHPETSQKSGRIDL